MSASVVYMCILVIKSASDSGSSLGYCRLTHPARSLGNRSGGAHGYIDTSLVSSLLA